MSDLVVQSDFLAEAHRKFCTDIIAITPPRIVGDADERDLEEVITHLLDIARVTDRYVLAIGRYAAVATPDKLIDADDLKEHFTDVLSGGLIGHATYVITSAIERLRNARYQGAGRRVTRILRGWI